MFEIRPYTIGVSYVRDEGECFYPSPLRKADGVINVSGIAQDWEGKEFGKGYV